MRILTDVELAWLAGLLEGEGHFFQAKGDRPVGIAVEMTDEDIIKKIASWWEVSYNMPTKRQDHYKQGYRCTIRGQRSVDLMIKLQPLMGFRRQEQIKSCINSHKPKGRFRKISEEDSLIVKARFRSGEKPEVLAEEFGISKWTVYAIHQERYSKNKG